jgi:pentatricopeptide repeat protein
MEQDKDMEPDKVTFVSALTACASIGALDEGIAIHNRIIDHGFESDFFIGNAIVNMYGKCAALQKAQLFFDIMPKRNVVTWTSLITAYAQQGHGSEALSLYRRMQEEKVMPNSTTFLSLISACGHAGLVGEALFYFASMTDEHGIEPKYEHYGSMVDLLGKAGLLSEAEDFIQKMPMEADACIWISLLGACRMHGDMERAKRAAENVAFLEGSNASPFILLFNMYASDGTENMPQLKKDNGKERRRSVGTRIRKM